MVELATWIPSLLAVLAFLALRTLPVAHHSGRRHYTYDDQRRYHC